MILSLYRVLTTLGAPVLLWLVERRAARGKEDRARRGERFGKASQPRPFGRLIWLHAASVGESLSALPVVRRLVEDEHTRVLVTTGTVTSARLMAERLPKGAFHQFAPIDRVAWVRRFLDHWRPDAALWVESEIWPNMLMELRARRIPAALINARMSARSFRRWRRVPRTIRTLLSPFRVCLAQTKREADRLVKLGARNVAAIGNLKYSAEPLSAEPLAFAQLNAAVAKRPVWAFASTHPGEEDIAARVHLRLKEKWPDLLTIVVPRHPARGEEVSSILHQRGLWCARRSEGKLPSRSDQAYVVDTLGEMGVVLRVAPIACLGNSFTNEGGHNPVEPAQLGCAVLYGPSMFNFAEIAVELEEAGAARRVRTTAELAEAVDRLLSDPEVRFHQAAAGRAVAERNRQVIDRVMEAIEPVLGEAAAKFAA